MEKNIKQENVQENTLTDENLDSVGGGKSDVRSRMPLGRAISGQDQIRTKPPIEKGKDGEGILVSNRP